MPLPQRWNQKRKKPPEGFDYVEPVLEALEAELRDVVQERDPKKRKTQAMWPVHQINWQKSRYIYDMFYVHRRISKRVYQYCLDQKLVDAALIAKWKKTGYERLCSTYVINPSNYKFGTTSICRVPWKDRSEEQRGVHDPTTGCLGCASGPNEPRNIFGNKYGQYLAAVQIAREERQLQKQQAAELQQAQELLRQQEAAALAEQEAEDDDDDDDDDEGPQLPPAPPNGTNAPTPATGNTNNNNGNDDDDGDAPTDDDDAETDDEEDDDDFGPSPAAGIWAGSQKLEQQSERRTYEEEENENQHGPPPAKKARS
mmetsp:Transcript_15595/g.43037  ORF Transcript_15595/g.43037 Transcript_15595/m.43037 type:complete len:313 (-) Transcript_15595:128-1066(-)|eukprot:CAMPEP_0168753316 /NCGR_PEP_ID=MMETSP0724-20121128/18869_1 /TAXON_ID=265536 /ORGANISM="Amphiprora sp., Strain CCMP467" /LENGTH=312 /DNA_ID=CAMNT_0008801653 /DNA_START=110 /DNA_END=1048 /DNA_ORIENTATION=-